MANINEADHETLEAMAEELISDYCGRPKCPHCERSYNSILEHLKEVYIMGQCST